MFLQVTFLSDSGNHFDNPKSVLTNGIKSQAVETFDFLWKNLDKFLHVCIVRLFFITVFFFI